MRIYIDEAGPFVVPATGSDSYSFVLTLAIPSVTEAELFSTSYDSEMISL
jgi:hypothetical protein